MSVCRDFNSMKSGYVVGIMSIAIKERMNIARPSNRITLDPRLPDDRLNRVRILKVIAYIRA